MKWKTFIFLLGAVPLLTSYLHSLEPLNDDPVCAQWGISRTVMPGVNVAHCEQWSMK